jgi:hypothetical protein
LPSELYGPFVDVGHYNRTLDSYLPLCDVHFRLCQPAHVSILQKFKQSVQDIDIVRLQNEAPSIRKYRVQELLGKGGFGTVYQVVDENEVRGHMTRDVARQDKTRQDTTRQDKTRQDTTRQDKARHNIGKTRPDENTKR